MSTVQRTRIERNTDATEWPGWTDDDVYGISDPAEWPAWTDQIVPALPPAADPDLPPSARSTYLPLAHWFECQVALHRNLSRDGDDLHELVATALNDVRCVILDRRCKSVADILAAPGTAYRYIDLARVAIPAEPRTSHVASLLDEEAAYYLDLGTELAKVAAWAILQHASAAEFYGSDSLARYLEDDAAWLAAAEATAVECEYPLW